MFYKSTDIMYKELKIQCGGDADRTISVDQEFMTMTCNTKYAPSSPGLNSSRTQGDGKHVPIELKDYTDINSAKVSKSTKSESDSEGKLSEDHLAYNRLHDDKDQRPGRDAIFYRPIFPLGRSILDREQDGSDIQEDEGIKPTYDTHQATPAILTHSEPQQNLTAKLTSDQGTCCITGLAMLPGNRLIAADFKNKVIKMLDTNNGTIISHIAVKGGPNDVAVVSRDRLAVTLADKIQFVNVSGDRLFTEGHLQVSPGCTGIACHENKLYVSCIGSPAQIQVLDLHGQILQTFIRDAAGRTLFNCPGYITVNNDGYMYISDKNKNTLTCLNPKGQVQWRYQDTAMRRPEGVVVDKHGTVHVICWSSSTKHVVSPAGKQLRVLTYAGIQSPYSLAFSKDGDRLYIGMCNSIVSVYKAELFDD